ncbi:MFS transporter, partial [Streptomyces sp. SP18CM02]|nr:MFS transporter [Streptomyces sp. SP18CM02]
MDTSGQLSPGPPAPCGAGPSPAAYRNLVMATVGFALTFGAWNLIAPMSGDYKDRLGLSSFQQSVLVAVPVLEGSLGRIPVGALTDKYGAKLMFPLDSAL